MFAAEKLYRPFLQTAGVRHFLKMDSSKELFKLNDNIVMMLTVSNINSP